MPIWKTLGLLVVCVLVLGSTEITRALEVNAAPDILAQAEEFERSGDTGRALSLLRQYVLEHPDAQQAPTAYARLSRIFIDEGRLEQARLYAERIPEEHRPNDLTLMLARAYMDTGDHSEAEQLLTRISVGSIGMEQRAEYMHLQARSALESGELTQTLIYCDEILQMDELPDRDIEQVCKTALEALKRMDDPQREESAFMFKDTPVGDLVRLYRIEQHEPEEIDSKAGIRDEAEKLARSATHAWMRERAVTWLDQAAGRPWHRRALGVVLPLSGRYAPFGRMVKQGIELAFESQEHSDIEFIVRDSCADVACTEAVMRELLDTERVMAVLGPMMGETAIRAAEMAQEARVPIILLSHWEGLPQRGEYVFRHSLTSAQQVEALVDYAVNVLNLERFALLQPENKLGDDFARLFRAALKRENAEVEYHRHYPPQSTDFRAALEPMSPPEEEEDHAEENAESAQAEQPEPEPEFDALFIPDFADTIALLAPQLAFADIEDVQLLGINGWNSEDLLRQAGPYVRGAVFSDGFDPDSSDIFVQTFVERYQKRYAEMPTILAAQGYDAAAVLIDLLRNRNLTRPDQVRAGLENVNYTGAVSGLRGFDTHGEARRDVVLFRFGRSRIERIDPAALQALKPEELMPVGSE
jgi:ABC-type branched-subunit amino acid transport system substrate-binding protein